MRQATLVVLATAFAAALASSDAELPSVAPKSNMTSIVPSNTPSNLPTTLPVPSNPTWANDSTVYTASGTLRISGDGWSGIVGPNAPPALASSAKVATLTSVATLFAVAPSTAVITSLSVGSLVVGYNVSGNASTLATAYVTMRAFTIAFADAANPLWMTPLVQLYAVLNGSATLYLLNASVTMPPGFPTGLIPSDMPSNLPSNLPSSLPSNLPSSLPTSLPSNMPTSMPSNIPSNMPSILPTATPTNRTPACSLPTLTVPANYTFDADQTIRISSGFSSTALSCGTPLKFTWAVAGTTMQGSSFVVAAGTLKPGTYSGQVTASYSTSASSSDKNDNSTTLTTSFTVIITVARPTVTISGGDRQVSVGAALTFAATGTSISSIAWQCMSDRVTCNFTSVSTLGTMQTATLATGFAAAGTYKVAVVATNAAGATAMATVTIRVVATAVNNVQLQTSAPSTVYVGRPIVVVAQAADGSQYAWSATDGTTKNGGSVATFKPTAAGTFNVTVTATSKSNVVGTASLTFTILELPTGTLTVTSTDSPIVGGTSPLVFTLSQWTGPSTATFRFGYLQYGDWNSLSDDFSSSTTQTYTAPLVLQNRSMIFAAQAMVGDGVRLEPITLTLSLIAPSNKSAAIAERQKVMQDAASVKDISTVLRAAQDVADASNTSSAASSVVAAVASVASASSLSATQKGAVVDVLATAVSDSGEAADAATQKQVAQCLKAVLANTSSTNAASSSDAVETSTRAAAMLALISAVNATAMANDTNNRDARRQLARDLALTVAEQLAVGQTSNVSSGDMTITAVKTAVSAAVATALNTTAGSISIPLAALASAMQADAAIVAQSGTSVAVSATSHGTNPVPSAAQPAGTTLNGSAILEFDVSAGGANFSSLSSAISLRIRVNGNVTASKLTCVYFDASTNTWSTAGVVTTDYNADDQTVGCNTTHLSMYAVATTASSTPGTADANTPATSNGGSSNSALYAGIGVGAAIVLVAGVVIVRRQRGDANAKAAGRVSDVAVLQPLNSNEAQLQVVERAPPATAPDGRAL